MPFTTQIPSRCLVPRKQVCDSHDLENLFKVISSRKPSLASAPKLPSPLALKYARARPLVAVMTFWCHFM